MQYNLTPPQSRMFASSDPYTLFVAGFGAGKTFTLAMCAIRDCLEFPGAKVACLAPTYDLLNLISVPYICEILESAKIPYEMNKSRMILALGEGNEIIFRSMDNPSRLVGWTVFRSHLDEIDTLATDKASDVWNKIIARNRQRIYKNGVAQPNRVSAYTTPEGFKFCYSRWVKDCIPGYTMVRARTATNPHLPADYADNLRATYPPQLVDAYLNGEFVNMTSGRVYIYDRHNHATSYTRKPREPVHVGMDFNVLNMSAAVFIQRDGKSYAVDEVSKALDTPQMIDILRERYGDSKITIYPDASSKNRSSKSASLSDLTLLRQAGFRVVSASRNPAIKDRVISVNSALHSGVVSINQDRCPDLTAALEQQVYDRNGQPEKNADDSVDDMCDAAGYYIYAVHPVVRRSAVATTLRGF